MNGTDEWSGWMEWIEWMNGVNEWSEWILGVVKYGSTENTKIGIKRNSYRNNYRITGRKTQI